MSKIFLFTPKSYLKYEIIIISIIICFLVTIPIITIIALADGNPINLTGVLYSGPGDPTDYYAYGNCTYWVALLRKQVNEPIPNTWGNANTWAIRAKQDGYIINHTPTLYSIMQTSIAPLGHVAFVTNVNLIAKTWTISEMNVIGWDMVDSKTMPINQAKNYDFIHNPTNKYTSKINTIL